MMMAMLAAGGSLAADNELTPEEQADGWLLLFDGETLNGWVTNGMRPSKTPVDDGCINPHRCGGYMLVHETQWGDFVLSLDFKMSEGCNSGVFLRTYPLTPQHGKSVGYNGIEMQVFDGTGTGFQDCGALYDLVKPSKAMAKPAGEWNHAEITCDDNLVKVVLNGEEVASMDLDEWTQPYKRPDGTKHKFFTAWKDHPRKGYIGLQDHGHPVWYKNIKLKPLNE